jgi:hypothetical protein
LEHLAMRPDDQQRFAKLVAEFIDGCEFGPPFHVIAIGSNGSVSVALHTRRDIRQICGHNPGRLASPITVTVVSEDGRGTSARIEIVKAGATMQ